MHIAFHIGAHCTDDERLLKSLLRNRDRLAEREVCVPGPGRYRALIGQAMTRLRGDSAPPEVRDMLHEAILDGAAPARLVLSNPSFISAPAMALGDGALYPRMFKAAWLRALFPDAEASFHLALRNPATFLPALHRALGPGAPPFERFAAGAEDAAPLWSDAVARLRAAVPDSPVTVWCDEDTPLIFEEVMRAVAGLGPEPALQGGFDVLRRILSEPGLRSLRAYTDAAPPASVTARRRVVAAFLERFAVEEEVMEEIDRPGWTVALVEAATAAYDRDLDRIAGLPGVTVIAP